MNKNEDNIDQGLRLLAPFARIFTKVTGNGPWLDGYVANLPPVPGPRHDGHHPMSSRVRGLNPMPAGANVPRFRTAATWGRGAYWGRR